MAVQLLYFARVAEAMGRDGEAVALPPGVATLGQLADWLAARDAAGAAAMADRSRLRFAIDQRMAGPDAAIAGAAEIAIFPPVTGG